MGREATKASGNPWYEARKKAAEYDDRLCSREGAAERLGMSVSAVADAELGLSKCMPVDKAVLMADLYRAPHLLNHYCLHECPIGCRHSVRGGGPAPDYADVSLCDYIRLIAKEHSLDMAEGDDDAISMEMAELLFDGTSTIDGIVATLYTAAWAFAELREKLKGYEATKRTADELLRQRVTPFENDPFSMVWVAFKNLHPDKECEVFWDQHQEDEHREEYGFTNFPSDGSTPQVFVYAEHPVNIQTETFAHELAHVAVGPEHEHDEVWEAAFDAIFKEYNRLGDLMFAKPEDSEAEENGAQQA